MSVAERLWAAFTAVIKLEDRVSRQAEALKAQQEKIEDLTGRVIRLETQLELLASAALVKRLKNELTVVRPSPRPAPKGEPDS